MCAWSDTGPLHQLTSGTRDQIGSGRPELPVAVGTRRRAVLSLDRPAHSWVAGLAGTILLTFAVFFVALLVGALIGAAVGVIRMRFGVTAMVSAITVVLIACVGNSVWWSMRVHPALARGPRHRHRLRGGLAGRAKGGTLRKGSV